MFAVTKALVAKEEEYNEYLLSTRDELLTRVEKPEQFTQYYLRNGLHLSEDQYDLVHLLSMEDEDALHLVVNILVSKINDSNADRLILLDVITLCCIKSYHEPVIHVDDIEHIHTMVMNQGTLLYTPYAKLLASAAYGSFNSMHPGSNKAVLSYCCMRKIIDMIKGHDFTKSGSTVQQWTMLEALNVIKDTIGHSDVFQHKTLKLLSKLAVNNTPAYDNILNWNAGHIALKGKPIALARTDHDSVELFHEQSTRSRLAAINTSNVDGVNNRYLKRMTQFQPMHKVKVNRKTTILNATRRLTKLNKLRMSGMLGADLKMIAENRARMEGIPDDETTVDDSISDTNNIASADQVKNTKSRSKFTIIKPSDLLKGVAGALGFGQKDPMSPPKKRESLTSNDSGASSPVNISAYTNNASNNGNGDNNNNNTPSGYTSPVKIDHRESGRMGSAKGYMYNFIEDPALDLDNYEDTAASNNNNIDTAEAETSSEGDEDDEETTGSTPLIDKERNKGKKKKRRKSRKSRSLSNKRNSDVNTKLLLVKNEQGEKDVVSPLHTTGNEARQATGQGAESDRGRSRGRSPDPPSTSSPDPASSSSPRKSMVRAGLDFITGSANTTDATGDSANRVSAGNILAMWSSQSMKAKPIVENDHEKRIAEIEKATALEKEQIAKERENYEKKKLLLEQKRVQTEIALNSSHAAHSHALNILGTAKDTHNVIQEHARRITTMVPAADGVGTTLVSHDVGGSGGLEGNHAIALPSQMVNRQDIVASYNTSPPVRSKKTSSSPTFSSDWKDSPYMPALDEKHAALLDHHEHSHKVYNGSSPVNEADDEEEESPLDVLEDELFTKLRILEDFLGIEGDNEQQSAYNAAKTENTNTDTNTSMKRNSSINIHFPNAAMKADFEHELSLLKHKLMELEQRAEEGEQSGKELSVIKAKLNIEHADELLTQYKIVDPKHVVVKKSKNRMKRRGRGKGKSRRRIRRSFTGDSPSRSPSMMTRAPPLSPRNTIAIDIAKDKMKAEEVGDEEIEGILTTKHIVNKTSSTEPTKKLLKKRSSSVRHRRRRRRSTSRKKHNYSDADQQLTEEEEEEDGEILEDDELGELETTPRTHYRKEYTGASSLNAHFAKHERQGGERSSSHGYPEHNQRSHTSRGTGHTRQRSVSREGVDSRGSVNSLDSKGQPKAPPQGPSRAQQVYASRMQIHKHTSGVDASSLVPGSALDADDSIVRRARSANHEARPANQQKVNQWIQENPYTQNLPQTNSSSGKYAGGYSRERAFSRERSESPRRTGMNVIGGGQGSPATHATPDSPRSSFTETSKYTRRSSSPKSPKRLSKERNELGKMLNGVNRSASPNKRIQAGGMNVTQAFASPPSMQSPSNIGKSPRVMGHGYTPSSARSMRSESSNMSAITMTPPLTQQVLHSPDELDQFLNNGRF